MKHGSTYSLKFRRRREGKTSYKLRLGLLKSDLQRVIVRNKTKNIIIQFADYDEKGDRILISLTSFQLKKFGWNFSFSTIPSAYLTGLLAGKNAVKKDIKKAVLDIGLQTPTKGCKIFGALKGLVDAGLDIPHDSAIYPDESRIRGEHLKNDALVKKFEEIKENLLREV
ncbi:MAG: 50S ribosomal protein L18 [Candidatus Thermoplasmatota archaeon]